MMSDAWVDDFKLMHKVPRNFSRGKHTKGRRHNSKTGKFGDNVPNRGVGIKNNNKNV